MTSSQFVLYNHWAGFYYSIFTLPFAKIQHLQHPLIFIHALIQMNGTWTWPPQLVSEPTTFRSGVFCLYHKTPAPRQNKKVFFSILFPTKTFCFKFCWRFGPVVDKRFACSTKRNDILLFHFKYFFLSFLRCNVFFEFNYFFKQSWTERMLNVTLEGN